ncbi:hypothetical protein [Bacillus weihaiensis]|uniref:hypothetical protein n=1 Tax=Bacillus weihaiensis TaxID=1547283 RepID=UPI002353CF37|nr:hypothetical protein [Bacillus weihaiensis]
MSNIKLRIYFYPFIIIFIFLTGCTSQTSTIPKEFENFVPENEGEYYLIGYQNELNESSFFQESIEQFQQDESVIGLTVFYKVNEDFQERHDELFFTESNQFIVLEKDQKPYAVESYPHFLEEIEGREK